MRSLSSGYLQADERKIKIASAYRRLSHHITVRINLNYNEHRVIFSAVFLCLEVKRVSFYRKYSAA